MAPGLELDWLMPVPPAPEPRPSFRADHRRLCPTCRTIRDGVFAAKVPTGPVPERVVALGAELCPLFGARLVVPALVVWPGWFDLTVVGERRGAWGDTLLAAPVGGSRWAAVDDRGRHYDGAATGAGSDGRLVHRDLSFAPALAPDARTLTLLVPISYDGWARRVTIDL